MCCVRNSFALHIFKHCSTTGCSSLLFVIPKPTATGFQEQNCLKKRQPWIRPWQMVSLPTVSTHQEVRVPSKLLLELCEPSAHHCQKSGHYPTMGQHKLLLQPLNIHQCTMGSFSIQGYEEPGSVQVSKNHVMHPTQDECFMLPKGR